MPAPACKRPTSSRKASETWLEAAEVRSDMNRCSSSGSMPDAVSTTCSPPRTSGGTYEGESKGRRAQQRATGARRAPTPLARQQLAQFARRLACLTTTWGRYLRSPSPFPAIAMKLHEFSWPRASGSTSRQTNDMLFEL